MSDIAVSICCLVYNHKDYIRQALDSFLMQKTNFKFELLINDDCSTDGTTEIIREYEAKYPHIIKPLYHTENQYSKSYRQGNLMSLTFNFPRVSGKYVAMCEGDDFWTDDTKLQKQYDALESHPECSFCAHTVRCTDEAGNPSEETVPANGAVDMGIISSEDAVKGICRLPYMFQTSSYFFRAEYLKELLENLPEFFEYSSSVDVLYMLFFASKGSFYRLPGEMSCYRINSTSSIMSDLTKATKDNRRNEKMIKHYTEHLKSIKAYNEYTNHRFEDDVLFFQYKTEYHLMFLKHEYKQLFRKKYKEVAPLFLGNSGKKELMYLRMLSVCPWMEKVIAKIMKK